MIMTKGKIEMPEENNKNNAQPQQSTNAEHVEKKPKVEEPTVPQHKYDELKQQATTYLNTARQLQADFDNYRRLTKDSKQEAMVEGMLKACETILPALDSFKKARKVVEDKKCLEGIKMIEDALLAELAKLKIKVIPTKNVEFNPDLHNAVALIEDPKVKSNMIIEELQAGYTYDGKVIRYSQVVVAK